ncbi:type II secretion system protein [Thalassomonas sp. M1454]|uniref:type II secretion system protein n=1 Tax=Thalassomonas sp. M1454 TaxID=2594477 RepID=UPI00117E2129|nr:type II secretion system protein [Thalassomonas sp. M1454]TRX52803.1 type II secretion system protein [Thalassomonas sp. M1454]
MSCNKSKSSGFTLIELVVVILIISILAITATPKLLGVSHFDSFAYRDQMVSSLRLMQQQAMQQTDSNACHRVVIQNKAYGRSIDCVSTIFATNWQDDNVGFAVPASSSVTINSLSTSTITFDSWGRAFECSNQCVIEFNNVDTARLCIESEGYVHAC